MRGLARRTSGAEFTERYRSGSQRSAAADAVSAEHPGSIGRRKVFLKSTTDDDYIEGLAPARRSHQWWRVDPRLSLIFRQRGRAESESSRRDAAFRYARNSAALH